MGTTGRAGTAGLSARTAQSTTMEFSVRSVELNQQQQQEAEQDTVRSLEEGEDSGEYEEVDQEEDKDTEGPEKPAADEDDDEEEDDDDDDVAAPPTEGSYDPSEFDHLAVDSEVRELFTHIVKYTPQTIELESKFKPFVPDYIPAVGDIDAFIRCSRPDNKQETTGLSVLDEPAAAQSDPSVVELQLRVVTKRSAVRAGRVKRVPRDGSIATIDKWIRDISDLHRTKPPPSVQYSKPMPDIDNLMEEWPEELEELLRTAPLPTAELSCDLSTQVDLVSSLLDIPRYKSRIQSLHVLFTLYSAFKSSQHFTQLGGNIEEGNTDIYTKNF